MRRLWLPLIFAGIGVAQISPDLEALLGRADQQVVRLDPKSFPELPTGIIVELQRRGCTIPQVPMVDGRHNVIKGEFAKPGQSDWAVLCSIGRISSVLIFWNGSTANLSSIAEMKDVDRLQSWTEGKMVYSRAISAVGKAYIEEHYVAYAASGAPKPPVITHEGIDDAFWGKASGVHFLNDRQWLRLQGAD